MYVCTYKYARQLQHSELGTWRMGRILWTVSALVLGVVFRVKGLGFRV